MSYLNPEVETEECALKKESILIYFIIMYTSPKSPYALFASEMLCIKRAVKAESMK